MATQIVTLTTDWGDRGFFAGMVKGMLHNNIDNLQVIDNTHHITPFNVIEASFVVRNSCPFYPKGTIHIVDVHTNYTPESPFVVVRANGQYYICCDNGLPYDALGDTIEDSWEIPLDESLYRNFAAYTIFSPVAVAIAKHTDPDKFLTPRPQLTRRLIHLPPYKADENTYNIQVQYIDSYGNIYLGITIEEFRELRGDKTNFELRVRDKYIKQISKSYCDDLSAPCLTVSASGLLEVALPDRDFMNGIGNGNIKIGSLVSLRFF